MTQVLSDSDNTLGASWHRLDAPRHCLDAPRHGKPPPGCPLAPPDDCPSAPPLSLISPSTHPPPPSLMWHLVRLCMCDCMYVCMCTGFLHNYFVHAFGATLRRIHTCDFHTQAQKHMGKWIQATPKLMKTAKSDCRTTSTDGVCTNTSFYWTYGIASKFLDGASCVMRVRIEVLPRIFHTGGAPTPPHTTPLPLFFLVTVTGLSEYLSMRPD